MNHIDIIICIPLVWGLYRGFVRGLIVEAATLVAFGLGVYGAVHFSGIAAEKLKELFSWDSEYLPITAFAITFLGIIILIFFIAKLIHKLAEGLALGPVNKILGALFGTLKFALVLSVIIFVVDAVEKSYPAVSFEAKNKSLLYKPIGTIAPAVIPGLTGVKNPLTTNVEQGEKQSEK